MNNTKTIYPQLVDTYFVSTIPLLSAYTNFLDLNQQYVSQTEDCIKYELSDSTADFITNNSTYFSTLNYKLSTLSNEFIDSWITKYNNSIHEIKQLSKGIFYQQYSDSIGLLVNSLFCLDDSTLNSTSNIYPTVYPSTIYSKLSKNTLKISEELSRYTTYTFRKNTKNLSLTPDEESIKRIQSNLQKFSQVLSDNYQSVYKLVQYYNTISNQSGYNSNNTDYNIQSISPVIIKIAVESSQASIDLLGKKINRLLKDKSINNTLGTSNNKQIKTTNTIDQEFIGST